MQEGGPLHKASEQEAQQSPPPQSPASRTRRERLHEEADHLRSEAGELLSGLKEIRPTSRTVSAGFLIFERDREFPSSLLIGSVAARLVIFLIPFLIFVIFIIGFGAELAATSAADAAAEAGLPGMFAQAAADSTAATGQWRLATVLVTAFALVWAANGLGRTMRASFAVVWRTPRQRVRRRWLVPLTVICVVLVTMVVSGVGARFNRSGPIDDAARLTVEFLLVVGIWVLLSKFLPHDPGADRWRDFLPGSMLVGVGLIAMRAAMVLYLIPKWASLSERYGDIGVILVMLSWAYLVGLATVGSAHVNAALFSTRRDPAQQSVAKRSWPLPDFLRKQWRALRGSGEEVEQ